MNLITWLVVGLVAGVLASAALRGSGYGLLGDLVLGIVGAVVGGWGFAEMGWGAPLPGLAGIIFVAFIGAVVVLAAARALKALTGSPDRR
ncbi:MAG: GlsB/YeaQ/YmgE family stress response membrane protein [Kofleriaceae bacterium]|jgi:uncharacterized membrane protein YeaQ/YmgE (transglycosylase-associated protein family)|nr:GlsB/YeaQ/YmgE family stress response membrane protein [Kofleriaceae bacterium]MBP6837571.1 GlsB/YeaQ/YmgE family stress response membrane protein [Kofleriaceae bacterium]MBP9203102.1 GlsB/YeaQ/YmgE family stress response membrane protein [Kofleriaceae bacterium]